MKLMNIGLAIVGIVSSVAVVNIAAACWAAAYLIKCLSEE